MTAVLNYDIQIFKQFSDNESFRRCLTDTTLLAHLRGHIAEGRARGDKSVGCWKRTTQIYDRRWLVTETIVERISI